jgi:molecular chaperone GrpE
VTEDIHGEAPAEPGEPGPPVDSDEATGREPEEPGEPAEPLDPTEPEEWFAAVESPGFGDAAGESTDATEVEFTDDLSRAQRDAAQAQSDVATLTADLQRLQAEYLNYKRRVDRDRDLVRENATYAALAPITEVLDTIDRAREHGPLEEGLRAVAEQLERVVAGLGLTRFGAPGDPFDPMIHEALSHIGEDAEVEVTTCKLVARAGYRIGDRVVRAAQVLVVDPVTEAATHE